MQYTRYMEQCRRRLSQGIELQTDSSIDIMISMQNVCLDALDTFTLYDFENVEVSGDLAIKSLVHGFMQRLKAIEEKANIQRGGPLMRTPPHFQFTEDIANFSSASEQRLLIYAQSYIHEVAIHKDFWPQPSDSEAGSHAISITRAQVGWEGLARVKILANYYANLPSDEWLKLDTGPVTQMLYSLIMLNKYVSLDSSDTSPNASNQWDIQLAFKEAEVQKVGTQIIEKLAGLVFVEKLYDDSRPIWWALGWIIKNMVHGHQARICGGMFPMPRPRKEDPLVETASEGSQQPRSSQQTPGNADNAGADAPGPQSTPVPAMDAAMVGTVHESIATRPPEPPFAMSFPDVTFDGSMMWQDGMYQNAVWDVMLNDMTTLPFG
jgi:hypothetical protein